MWKFERAYIATEEIDNGPLSARYLNIASGLAVVLFGLSLLPLVTAFTVPQLIVCGFLALILARLLAIDLCYLLLPNIYVLPLLITGPLLAPIFGHIDWQSSLLGIAAATLLGLALTALVHVLQRPHEIGMGDIKLLLVLGAWLGMAGLPVALAISCFIGLGLSFLVARGQAFPFGPALIIGLWAMIFYGDKMESLLLGLMSSIPNLW